MAMRQTAVRVSALLAFLLASGGEVRAHSTTSAISTSRSFSSDTASPGDTVTVTITVEFDAIGSDPVRGFFLSDHIPVGLSPSAGNVTLGGSGVSATVENGEAGSVYPGCTTTRWVTETPPEWSEGIPIPASSELVITYEVTVPSDAANGPITFPGYTWVAMIAAQGSAGDHFGYEDDPATITVEGSVEPGDPDAGSIDNPAASNGDLQGGCATGGPGASPALALLFLALFGARRRSTR